MPYCAKCGNELPEGVRFCPRCGNEVSEKERVSKEAKESVGPEIPSELSSADYEKLKLKVELKSVSKKKRWGIVGIAFGFLISLIPTIFLAMDYAKTTDQITALADLAKLCIILGGLMLISGIAYSTYGSWREKKIRKKLGQEISISP
jgi:uncharacterized membrane protein YvbJ